MGDILLFWGIGYFMLFYFDFVGYDIFGSWLVEWLEKIWFIGNGYFYDECYGEGWLWDDYFYGY